MQEQTEILRIELHDALQREVNLKKINESLMNAIARQPEELQNYSKEIQAIKLRHIAQIVDLKSLYSKKQEELCRQLEERREKERSLEEEVSQREEILKIMSLKIHQNQLSTKDYQKKIKEMQQTINSQKLLINNAKNNIQQHMILKQNLNEANRKEIEYELSVKFKRILQDKEVAKESELSGLRRTIDVLNAKIKLLEKQKEYYCKLEANREKQYYK